MRIYIEIDECTFPSSPTNDCTPCPLLSDSPGGGSAASTLRHLLCVQSPWWSLVSVETTVLILCPVLHCHTTYNYWSATSVHEQGKQGSQSMWKIGSTVQLYHVIAIGCGTYGSCLTRVTQYEWSHSMTGQQQGNWKRSSKHIHNKNHKCPISAWLGQMSGDLYLSHKWVAAWFTFAVFLWLAGKNAPRRSLAAIRCGWFTGVRPR